MTKKAILLVALVAILQATTILFASMTGTRGKADRIALRDAYSQYTGKVDLRDGTGVSAVTFYYWGGDRCPGATGPTDRQIDILLSAHIHGREVSFDYNEYYSNYGVSRCWDGGIQVW